VNLVEWRIFCFLKVIVYYRTVLRFSFCLNLVKTDTLLCAFVEVRWFCRGCN
jgi:hypothetical protein